MSAVEQTIPRTYLSPQTLQQENVHYQGTGGVSRNNRWLGFRPAFLDTLSGHIHLSCFADGRPAPIHLLDGLPDELVVKDDSRGRCICATVISGFVMEGQFFTREQAAEYLDRQASH